MLLHSWWWARPLRFYTEILLLFSLFFAIFLYIFSIEVILNKKLQKITLFLIVLIILFEQNFIFFLGLINQETTFLTLNNYDPIKQASEYVVQNFSKEDVLVVPEWVVYTTFIKDRNVLDYRSGFNYLLSTNSSIYFFTDNLHSWLVDPFYPKNGKISFNVQTQQGIPVTIILSPKEIKTFDKKSKERTINTTIWKIEGFETISS
jgi:hypothetical protein